MLLSQKSRTDPGFFSLYAVQHYIYSLGAVAQIRFDRIFTVGAGLALPKGAI